MTSTVVQTLTFLLSKSNAHTFNILVRITNIGDSAHRIRVRLIILSSLAVHPSLQPEVGRGGVRQEKDSRYPGIAHTFSLAAFSASITLSVE